MAVVAAVAATKASGKLEAFAEIGDFFSAHALAYRGGARYPHLERADSGPDLVGEIIKPLAPPGGR